MKKLTVLKECIAGSLVLSLTLATMFVMAEPGLGLAIEDQFIVRQTVTSEISFATTAADVTMTPSLGGITGGTSNGTTTVVVTTNDNAGYTMTVSASSSPAMQSDETVASINDYTPASPGVPDYNYSVAAGAAEFGYTVNASTTGDLAQKFLDDGANTCNTGAANTSIANCWYGLSTTATSTIVRNTETSAFGSTSSLVFKLTINSGAFVSEGTYTATATLTATTN